MKPIPSRGGGRLLAFLAPIALLSSACAMADAPIPRRGPLPSELPVLDTSSYDWAIDPMVREPAARSSPRATRPLNPHRRPLRDRLARRAKHWAKVQARHA